ncbi:MAG: DUF2889 domain-containing protein [Syntrophales bacterium]|jgi:hypothetical protein
MITFSRSQLISAEFIDDDTVRFHGTQEDHIYDMEILMDVRISDGVILSIQGWMKRYTTPVCPKAVDVLQSAVGLTLRGEGWMSKIMKEIGQKGCEHFAEIINECGRCLDQARMTRALTADLQKDASVDISSASANWIKDHPEKEGRTLAMTTGS